uniref:Holo-[acyl-carrier-protein] synthase n=1 Tax=candidate division WOR-3 bacterium TaxID=2052148 RepID=A0A7C4YSG7_UNCW3
MEIGIDIVDIRRMKRVIERWNERFIDRVFSNEEKNFCFDRKNYEECFSGKFAAKEAVFKTLKSNEGITLMDIEIIDRKVYIKKKYMENIKVSISHEKEFAIAVAVNLDG